jgi:hypothetical protein
MPSPERRCSEWWRNANALASARALRVARSLDYCGLRDAVADAVPATSTAVALVECSTSTDPVPFAATEPLLVVAFKLPAPVMLAAGAGFCAVAEAAGAALELTFGLGVCTWAAVLAAVLTAVLLAVVLTLLVVLDAGFTGFAAGCEVGLLSDPPTAP